MKKLVLKIDMLDEGGKRKAMKTVAGLSGIDSIAIDMKERKLTIIGTVDPTKVVSKLRKYWTTELVTVGPAKEPEKEEPKNDKTKQEETTNGEKKPTIEGTDNNETKKEGNGDSNEKNVEEGKKEESKKEGEEAVKASGGGGGGGEGVKKVEEEKKVDPVMEMVKAYRAYNPQMTKYYYVQSMEENPNACVIC